MEGYRLTTKGYITITLLFFILIVTPVAILTLGDCRGEAPPGDVPTPVSPRWPDETIPVSGGPPLATPMATEDMRITQAPPTVGLMTVEPLPTETSPPGTPSVSPSVQPTNNPASAPPSAGLLSTADPLQVTPSVSVELELWFPFSQSELSSENRELLLTYLESVPDSRRGNATLVVEGHAYSGEASDDDAVANLARERMRSALDNLPAFAAGMDILPVSFPQSAISGSTVPGVLIYFIARSGK